MLFHCSTRVEQRIRAEPTIATPSPTSPTAPIRHETVDVGEVRLHVAAAGDPAAPLVVFLHGFPEFWYAWKDQLEEFGADHLAVAPDQRGYGLSDRPEGVAAYRVDRLVADVAGLADHYGRERFSLVAHDWGGIVAWAFARALPGRLDRLVIVNSPYGATFARELATNPAQREASAYMTLFASPEAEAALSAGGFAALDGPILRDGVARGFFTEEERAMYLAEWARPGALTAMLNWYRAAGIGPHSIPEGSPPRGAPDPIRVPTLVIWGEKDPYLVIGNLDGLEEHVPDLTVRRVPEADHWIVHQEPELVCRWIRAFLDGGRPAKWTS